MRFFMLCWVALFLCSCGVPEFTPPPSLAPAPIFGESVTAEATWYGSVFHGRTTGNGELFDKKKLTASHESIPYGTLVEVTNPDNGKNVQVVINDRHNLDRGHQLCISEKAAKELDVYPKKTFTVNFMVIE